MPSGIRRMLKKHKTVYSRKIRSTLEAKHLIGLIADFRALKSQIILLNGILDRQIISIKTHQMALLDYTNRKG